MLLNQVLPIHKIRLHDKARLSARKWIIFILQVETTVMIIGEGMSGRVVDTISKILENNPDW